MPQEPSGPTSEGEERAPLKTMRPRPVPMLALCVVLVALPVAWGLQQKKSSRSARADVLQLPALVAFDDVVQDRLAVVPFDNSFGMSRVITKSNFRPVTPPESLALSQLRSSGLDVALYMAGRSIYDRAGHVGKFTTVSGPTILTEGPLRKFVQGHEAYVPVVSSSGSPARKIKPPPADLPTPAALQERVAGLLSGKGATPLRWKSGAWDVVAVPVPASKQACVNCHNQRLQIFDPAQKARRKELGQSLQEFEPLKVGDVAGVAIYAYRPHNTAS